MAESKSALFGRLPLRPTSVSGLVLRFTLAGVAATLLLALATALVSRRLGTREAVADARHVTWVNAVGIVEPNLQSSILTSDPDAVADVDALVHKRILTGSLVRVKLWNPLGTVLYSDEPRLIGMKFTLGPEERAMLVRGGTEAGISDLSIARK